MREPQSYRIHRHVGQRCLGTTPDHRPSTISSMTPHRIAMPIGPAMHLSSRHASQLSKLHLLLRPMPDCSNTAHGDSPVKATRTLELVQAKIVQKPIRICENLLAAWSMAGTPKSACPMLRLPQYRKPSG